MNKIILIFIFFIICLPTLSKQNDDIVSDICEKTDENNFCHIPFELVYTNRKDFYGMNVQLEGILIAGKQNINSELLILLFPSIDHAKHCNLRLAVKLAPTSNEIEEQLATANYWMISVSGRFHRHPGGLPPPFTGIHWADIEITSEPIRIANMSDHFNFNCLSSLQIPPRH